MTKILNVKINAPGKRTLSVQIKTHETAINLRNQQNKSMLVTFIVQVKCIHAGNETTPHVRFANFPTRVQRRCKLQR